MESRSAFLEDSSFPLVSPLSRREKGENEMTKGEREWERSGESGESVCDRFSSWVEERGLKRGGKDRDIVL